MQKLRVGIIGAGRIGQVHAKSITYHIPQAEIVAISDLFPKNAQKVADDLVFPRRCRIITKFSMILRWMQC